MRRREIEKLLKTALTSVHPIELKVFRKYQDVLQVLVVSDSIGHLDTFARINRCVMLISRKTPKSFQRSYSLIVQPVTVQEYKARFLLWPH